MYQDRRKLIWYAIFGVLLISIIGYTVSYFGSTRTVAVTSKNITSFSIGEQDKKASKQLAATKQSVRVKKGKTYTLSYVGKSGYANGSTTVTPSTTTVAINPDYSAEKLSGILTTDIAAINTAITSSGTSIDTLYTIQKGTLSNFGAWYFTTLTYNGSKEDASSDTLIVGLQKKQGVWTVVLTPDIIFTTAAYPDVSRDFIDAANAYQNSHIIPVEV